MTYHAGILRNAATDRYHPIIFRPAPMPGGADAEMSARRYRSAGHHTTGFATLAEAEAHIAEHPEWTATGAAWEWDGEGVPALTSWFASGHAEVPT